MVVDIRGTQAKNKGAQLMMIAIAQRLGNDISLAVKPAGDDYAVRARLGLGQTLHTLKYPRLSAKLGNALPRVAAERYGLVRDRDISGVLDAAGYGYADPFGEKLAKREALFGRTWRRRGVPKVMLPQAFGPFTDAQTRRWSRELLAQADLIFARDRISAGYLAELNLNVDSRLAPDFTIGVHAPLIDPIAAGPFLAIVPNGMLIRTGVISAEQYADLLGQYVQAGRAIDLEPVVVAHDIGDLPMCTSVSAANRAALYQSSDPLELKAALGQASAVVSCRYHAVVGALSQGVPTIALGWSHKYLELLRDFGVPEWLANLNDNPRQVIADLLSNHAAVEVARSEQVRLLTATDQMWDATKRALLDRQP